MTEKENIAFEKWFKEKKDNYEVWGNGDDFYVDDEIKKFCKLAYEQGLADIKAIADKAYCEKANAEIKLDEAKEIIKKFLYNVEPYSIDNDVLDEAETFMKNIELLEEK